MFATSLSRIATVAVAAIAVLPVAALADTPIPNGSFETGDLTFFGSAGTATVVTAAGSG